MVLTPWNLSFSSFQPEISNPDSVNLVPMNLNQWTLSPSLIQSNFGILTQHLHQLFHRHLQMFQLGCPFQQSIKGN